MNYLKDESYYEELYDKGTILQCRLTEKTSQEIKKNDIKSGKKAPEGYDLEGIYRWVNDVITYFKTGDRYLEKEKTIREWMDKDQQRDELYQKPEPLAYCPKCSKRMDLIIKDLREDFETNIIRVLYLYRCEECKEKRGVYDDGQPYVFEGDYCPKCKNELESKTKKTKNKITITSTCNKCSYIQDHLYDLSEKPKYEEIDPDFEKDRARFCLSKEEGEKYRDWRSNLNWLVEHEKDKEAHKEEYEKAQKTKILTVAQLSDLLSKEFSKQSFGGLMISSPEIGRDLVIGFNIQDTKADRSEYDSKKDLKKILNDCLEDTNWHLMSDGLNYKLGIIGGRLRGQDSQQNIYEDIKGQN